MKDHLNRHISENVIRRLPRYLRQLDLLAAKGVQRISSRELSDMLGFTASQIRQDLSNFGEFGQQGYGYNVESLRAEIAKILGMDRNFRAVLVGVGNLGRALAGHFDFNSLGITLVGAYDKADALCDTEVAGVTVRSNKFLVEDLQKEPVEIAMLCVPRHAAQRATERLIEGGVQGIWNFTGVELEIPKDSDIVVENVHFADSMLALSYLVKTEYEHRENQSR